MKYLLDTDIASFYLRGEFNLVEPFRKAGFDNLRLSVVTVSEMRVVPYMNPNDQLNFQTIDKLSRLLGVLHPDERTWDLFSEIKARALRMRKKPGDFDVLQSALAKQNGMVVVTHNCADYEGITDFEDWVTV